MTCLGNRLKAVLLLYQGGEDYERNKTSKSDTWSNCNTPWKSWIDPLQQIIINTDGMI